MVDDERENLTNCCGHTAPLIHFSLPQNPPLIIQSRHELHNTEFYFSWISGYLRTSLKTLLTFQVSSSKHTLTLPHPTPPTPPISSTHTHPPISSNHKQTQNEMFSINKYLLILRVNLRFSTLTLTFSPPIFSRLMNSFSVFFSSSCPHSVPPQSQPANLR